MLIRTYTHWIKMSFYLTLKLKSLHLSGGLVWILLIGYLATGPTVIPLLAG